MILKVTDSKGVSVEKQFLSAVKKAIKINQALSNIAERICDIDEEIARLSNSIPDGEEGKKKALQYLKNSIRVLKSIQFSGKEVRRHLIPVYKTLHDEKHLKYFFDRCKTLLAEKRNLFKEGEGLGQQKLCLFEEMTRLYHQGVNVNAIYAKHAKSRLVDGTVKKVRFKYSPLDLAARGGDLEVVKYLICVCDADVNQCALTMAVDHEHHDVAQFLESRIAKISAEGKAAKVQPLSEQKSDVHLPSVVEKAAVKKNFACCFSAVKKNREDTPLPEAKSTMMKRQKRPHRLSPLGSEKVAKMRASLFSGKAVIGRCAGFGEPSKAPAIRLR